MSEESDKVITHFQNTVVEFAIHELKKNGDVLPFIMVLSRDKNGGYGESVIQIDPDGIEHPRFKDYLVQKILPEMFLELKAKQSEPIGTVFISEAWVKAVPIDKVKDPDKLNFSKAPYEKKEVLMCVFETMERNWMTIYYINRSPGISVSKAEEGNGDAAGGRFSGLFKKAREYEQRIKN